jgi:hypothetical protein
MRNEFRNTFMLKVLDQIYVLSSLSRPAAAYQLSKAGWSRALLQRAGTDKKKPIDRTRCL